MKDNGIGIAPELSEKIFDIFYHLDQGPTAGEGLGLTVVWRALSQHGGEIWVESEPGKGSKFFVSLPAGDNMQESSLKQGKAKAEV